MRENDPEIWSDIHKLDINISNFMTKKSYKHIAKLVDKNKVDWNDVISLVRNHNLSRKFCKQIGIIISNNTISWNDLLKKYADDEPYQLKLKLVFETYKMKSDGYFTHATPTLFNSGTLKPQN